MIAGPINYNTIVMPHNQDAGSIRPADTIGFDFAMANPVTSSYLPRWDYGTGTVDTGVAPATRLLSAVAASTEVTLGYCTFAQGDVDVSGNGITETGIENLLAGLSGGVAAAVNYSSQHLYLHADNVASATTLANWSTLSGEGFTRTGHYDSGSISWDVTVGAGVNHNMASMFATTAFLACNMQLDWGDGGGVVTNIIHDSDSRFASHTYSSAGTYTITLTGSDLNKMDYYIKYPTIAGHVVGINSINSDSMNMVNCERMFGLALNCVGPYPSTANMTNVTNAREIFRGCPMVGAIDLSGWTSVTDCYYGFYLNAGLTAATNLNSMDALVDGSYMFNDCASLTMPASIELTSLVDGTYMFYESTSMVGALVLNCPALENMLRMFMYSGLTGTPDLTGCVSVTDMERAFSLCAGMAGGIDLTPMGSTIESLVDTFNGSHGLTTPPVMTGIGSSLTDMNSMCYNVNGLTSTPDMTGLTGVTNASSAFRFCTGLIGSVDMSGFTALVTGTSMFDDGANLTAVTGLENCTALDNASSMFESNNIATAPNLTGLTALTVAEGMFNGNPMAGTVDLTASTLLTNMGRMFLGTSITGTPVVGPNATVIERAFMNCTSITGGSVVPSSIIDISEAFRGCTSMITPPNLTAVTATCTTADNLCNGCSAMTTMPVITGLTGVTNATSMFQGTSAMAVAVSITGLDNVTIGTQMFYDSGITSIDLEEMTALVTGTTMFYNASALTMPDMSGLTSLTGAFQMFYGTTAMSGLADFSLATSLTDMSRMFWLSGVTTATLPSTITDMEYAFYQSDIITGPIIPASVTILSRAFEGCTALVTPPNFASLTSATTAINQCFDGCTAMTTDPDMSGLTGVTNAAYAFRNTSAMTGTIDCSGMAAVTTSTHMFYGTGATIVNVTGMTALATTDAEQMFSYATNLTGVTGISALNGITSLYFTFKGCTALTSVDLTNFTSLTNCEQAFNGCTALTSVTFTGCTAVTTLRDGFVNCTSLASITLSPLTGCTTIQEGFTGCTSLTSIDLSGMTSLTQCYRGFKGCTSMTGLTVGVAPTDSVTDWRETFENTDISAGDFDSWLVACDTNGSGLTASFDYSPTENDTHLDSARSGAASTAITNLTGGSWTRPGSY